MRAVTEDASPRGATTFALWEPPLTALRGEHGAPVRRAAGAEAAGLLADLVVEGARTLAFVRSRRGAELTALSAQRHLAEAGLAELAARVAAYRAGYLPEERRALEARPVDSGELLGRRRDQRARARAWTSRGLDAVVLAGYPGHAGLAVAAGRAGRAGRGAASLVVFVARDDPLDTYLVHHPEAVFGRPVEATVFDPDNPYVLGPQLCCAAAELPLHRASRPARCSAPAAPGACSTQLDRRGAAAAPARPAGTGRRREPAATCRHPRHGRRAGGRGRGRHRRAARHGRRRRRALARCTPARSTCTRARTLRRRRARPRRARWRWCTRDDPDWTTIARDVTDIAIVATSTRRSPAARSASAFGTVDVTNQVVGYLRRRISTGEVIDETPLDLPPRAAAHQGRLVHA